MVRREWEKGQLYPREITALDFYLRLHNSTGKKAEQLLLDNPEYAELLAPCFKPISQELLKWMIFPNEHKIRSIHYNVFA